MSANGREGAGAGVSPELENRLLEVIHGVEREPNGDLSINALADRCDLSPYHFQRMFRAVTGESVKQWVLRIRLQRAALILKTTDHSVTQIAAESGFATHAGFTKAFGRRYGKSPLAFRVDARTLAWAPSPELVELAGATVDPGARAAAQLEWMPAREVAVMRHVGSLTGVFRVWAALVRWARDRGLWHDDVACFDFHYDDWRIDGAPRYRYDAGVEVDAERSAELRGCSEVSILEIPAGWVAKVEIDGTLTQLDRTWWWLVHEWLPDSGYQIRTEFAFDRYPARQFGSSAAANVARAVAGVSATLCLPVERAGALT